MDGCCCCEESVGGVGGFAFTGVVVGAVVGAVVEGLGGVEVGMVPVVVEGGNCVGRVNVDFNDAAIDSILFSKVAPKRCSKACRSKVEGLVDGA